MSVLKRWIMVEPCEVESRGLKVKGVATIPDAGRRSYPCVILSHGLLSSKDSSKHIALSEALDAHGIASCRFDYHGCGESEGRVEETTLSIRIDNLERTKDWVLRHASIDAARIGLLGSSFGGATSLVVAARDATVRCISLWSTPYLLENKEENSLSGTVFKESIFKDFAGYDLLAEARRVSHGLVVHGEMDEVVPLAEARAIYENLREPKKFELIGGGDHVFSRDADRERAIRLATEWFAAFLS